MSNTNLNFKKHGILEEPLLFFYFKSYRLSELLQQKWNYSLYRAVFG